MNPVLFLIERRPREARLSPQSVTELLAVAPKRLEIVPTRTRNIYRLTSQGLVGEIRLSKITIRIRPKIRPANLAFLMGFDPSPEWASLGNGTDFLDLVAIRLAELMRARLRVGLVKRYVTVQERQPFVKGRLDVAAQLRESNPLTGQLHCEFETYTENHVFHQIPRAAAERLLQSALASESRRSLEESLVGFGSVSPLDPNRLRSSMEPCPPGYEPLVDLSRWILRDASPSPNFLLDLETLFEQFLTRRLAESLTGTPFQIESQRRITIMEESGEHADLLFFPDIAVRRDDRVVSLLDAKWKRLGTLPDADDVHQAIAYGTTEGVGDVRLIYPGHRFATRLYPLPSGGMRLLVQTVRVVGRREKCEVAWRRFARSVIR